MVVGAVAVAAHGVPRASVDVDFVVHLPFEERARVETALRALGASEIDELRDEFGRRLAFEGAPGLDVEVFFTPRNVVYDREFARRKVIPVRDEPVPFISPEDLVLRKLANCRLRRGHDFDDAKGILFVQGERFDHAYLRAHCALARVCDLFERALAEAREARAQAGEG